MAKSHTDRSYESQLKALREGLLLTAGRVEQMISDAVRGVVERDAQLARLVIDRDAQINRAEIEIDDLCLQILARRQPMASDLRFITLSLKMVTDLERIGDLAVNIAERAIDLADEPPLTALEDISLMGEKVRLLVRQAVDAFVEGDVEQAEAVVDGDDDIDSLYIQVFRDMLRRMTADPDAIERGIHLQSIAKWLERMGDHAENLAEQVIFMIKGKDVRHLGRRGRAALVPPQSAT
ncbi:MAG: phosphate signaling complex protein PhoU [Deltaproteobacteria bacterium]|nr:phosphate signaling complex protein PhoU [Deltaproteobacteria bacterium]